MPPVIEQQDWATLEHQTGDLVSQGKHGYPQVQRDLSSLLQVSANAQNRTNKLRSQDEQAAATRLLATQGLDGGRYGNTTSCHGYEAFSIQHLNSFAGAVLAPNLQLHPHRLAVLD